MPVLFDSEQGMIEVLVPVMFTTESYQKLKAWAKEGSFELSLDEAIPLLVTQALNSLWEASKSPSKAPVTLFRYQSTPKGSRGAF